MTRRYYQIRDLEDVAAVPARRPAVRHRQLRPERRPAPPDLDASPTTTRPGRRAGADGSTLAADAPEPANLVVDLYLAWPDAPADADPVVDDAARSCSRDAAAGRAGRRVTVTVCSQRRRARSRQFTFRPVGRRPARRSGSSADMHPLTGQRLDLWRLKNFNGTRLPRRRGHLPVPPGRARTTRPTSGSSRSPRSATSPRCATTTARSSAFPAVERVLAACLDGIRRAQASARRQARSTPTASSCYVWPTDRGAAGRPGTRSPRSTAPLTAGAGLEEITVLARLQERAGRRRREEVALRFSYRPGAGVRSSVTEPPTEPLPPLDAYTQKVQRLARPRHGLPVRAVPLLTGAERHLRRARPRRRRAVSVPVERPPGQNKAGIVVGLVTTPTDRYPEGMTRVALFGDPTKALGTVAEPECARVIAGARPGRGAAASRSSGSRCPPAPRSRWTAAPRTWTGSPGRCAGSSRSPRPAARSTSSSPASTSARSRTGTPRRRC